MARPLLAQDPVPVNAAEARFGAAVVRLDERTIRNSAARTLADLLAGRVAGFGVTYGSGTPGLAPQLRVRGSAGSVGAGEPFLYVDGVLMRDDPFFLGTHPDGHRPSFTWDLPVDEIESVVVVPGQAAGAALEWGAPRGAVLVRTRRPAAGTVRVSAFAQGLSTRETTDFPVNMTTEGTGMIFPPDCSLSRQAMGQCTATGRVTWNPLEQVSPFRNGAGARAGVSATAGSRIGAYRASALFDRTDAVLSPARTERVDLAASLATTVAGGTRLDIRARHANRLASYLPWETLLRAGQLGSAYDDPSRGYAVDVAQLLASSRPMRSTRTSMVIGAARELRGGIEGEAQLAADRYSRRGVVRSAFDGPPPVTTTSSEDGAIQTWSGSAGVRMRHGPGQLASLGVKAFWSRSDISDSAGGTASTTPPSQSWTLRETRVSTTGLSVTERATFADRVSLGGTLRLASTSYLDRVVGRSAFLGFDGSYDMASATFLRGVGALDHLVLHAAFGDGTDFDPLLGAAVEGEIATDAYRFEEPPRTTETELGIRSAWFSGMLSAEARTFRRRDSELPFVFPLPSMSGFSNSIEGGNALTTTGEELRVALNGADAGPVVLNLVGSISTARTVVRMGRPDFVHDVGGPGFVVVSDGRVFGDVATRDLTWNDTNADGIIDQTEITLSTTLRRRGPSRPTRLFAISGDVRWSAVSIGAVLDGQGGHVRYDAAFERRCSVGVCEELHDPSTPLQRQAEAVASRYLTYVGPVREGDFMRLRELWFRIDLGGRWVPSRLGSARLTLSGHQVATWSRHRWMDPEVGRSMGPSVQRGPMFDQPVLPTWSLRLDLGR